MSSFYKENKTIKKCDVALIGDSLVEMLDINLFKLPNKVIMNRGIVSDKTAGVLMSLDDRLFPINPKTVFLKIGSNDICDGYLIKEIYQNFIDIIDKIYEHNIDCKIIVSTIIPPCYYPAEHVDLIYPNCRDINRIIELNNLVKKLPEKYPNLLIFDTFKILADENNSLRVEDTLDGVHLTKQAYEKYVDKLKELF